jgi:hypothetical protein
LRVGCKFCLSKKAIKRFFEISAFRYAAMLLKWFQGSSMTESPKKRGRPKGKRSSSEYVQVAGYIRKNTFKEMRHLLIDEEMEISELLQELIDEWILLKRNSN